MINKGKRKLRHTNIKEKKEVFDDMVFKIKADFLKQLAHPVRLRIIELLKDGEYTVSQLMQALNIEQSNLSKHLGALRSIGILITRQEKVNVFYRIKDYDIFKVLRPIAEILRKKLKQSEQLLVLLGVEK